MARDLCRSVGGSVLKIRNQEEQTFFESLNMNLWLDVDDQYKWRDGTPIKYSKIQAWMVGSCAYLDGSSKIWRSSDCALYVKQYVMCEVLNSTPPTQLPITVAPTTGYSLSLKDIITSHNSSDIRDITNRRSPNERLDNIERRLEQISNVVINRQEAIDEIKDSLDEVKKVLAVVQFSSP